MAFDKDAFLTALDGMSVMELNDLVKAIDNALSGYFHGQVGLNEATTKAVQDANAVLSL